MPREFVEKGMTGLSKKKEAKNGLRGESNSGPLAPEARIIPLDHKAVWKGIQSTLFEALIGPNSEWSNERKEEEELRVLTVQQVVHRQRASEGPRGGERIGRVIP